MIPTISGEFTAVADPELRFTPSGMAVCNVRLVADKQKKDGDQWVDDKVFFVTATAFKKVAENIAASVVKGTRLVVSGKMQTDQWDDKTSGEKRSAPSLVIDEIGVSLRYDTVTVNRAERAQHQMTRDNTSGPGGLAADDPWATTPSDEPPF